MEIGLEFHGLKELEDALVKRELEVVTIAIKHMNRYTNLVEKGARALAQRFDGDLEQSIIAAKSALRSGVIVGSVGTNLVYAWRRHEEPYKPGLRHLYHRGAKLENYYLNGLGERSRNKETWRGVLPGRKYLQNAVTVTEQDFDEFMEDALAEIIGGI